MSELKSADAAKVRTSADIVSRDGEAAASAFVSKRIMSLATSPTLAPDELANGVGALIIGGAHGSLAVARSLGRHRIPVWFLTHEQLIPRFSRYTRRTLQWPGPEHQDAAAYLLELADRHHLADWVLLPGGDAEAKFIAQNHAALSLKFRVTTPPWDVARWAFDKRLTYERAASLGIDCPWSHYPRSRQDVAALECRFPLVLKPTRREGHNVFISAKAWRVDDRAALLARYDQAAAMVGENGIALQEMIPGGGATQFSYAAVWSRGMPVASLVARRTRQYPIEFGYTSTYVETIENEQVEQAACRFLRSLDYDDLVEVEFKYGTRDGRYKILDVNARTWTWNALGQAAGVDFPYLLWQLAMGESVAPLRGRPGAAWMHLSRDVVAACQEMLMGRLSPANYLRSFRAPLVFAEFAVDDCMPGALDLPLLLFRTLRYRLPAMAREIAHALRFTAGKNS